MTRRYFTIEWIEPGDNAEPNNARAYTKAKAARIALNAIHEYGMAFLSSEEERRADGSGIKLWVPVPYSRVELGDELTSLEEVLEVLR